VSDNDNVKFVNFGAAKQEQPDLNTVDSFLEGVDEHNSYTDAQRAAKAVMHGIVKVATDKYGISSPVFYEHAAAISVLIFGMFLSQRGIETPETFLLQDFCNSISPKGDEE
jgi:hypothetical protein